MRSSIFEEELPQGLRSAAPQTFSNMAHAASKAGLGQEAAEFFALIAGELERRGDGEGGLQKFRPQELANLSLARSPPPFQHGCSTV
eukprot:gene5206-1518_t